MRPDKEYATPTVTDLGDLVTMTAACVGGGDADESFKGDEDPFQFSSPAFGDPAFCTE
jgi:hypothetical protein